VTRAEPVAADVLPRWTPRRVVTLSLLAALLLVLLGVGMGLLASYLDAGTGERVWRGRIRLGIMAIPPVVLALIGAWLWRRSSQMEAQVGPGEARLVRRDRGFWTVLGLQVIAGSLIGGLGMSWFLHPGTYSPEMTRWLAMALAVLSTGAMIWGTMALMPRMDELELQDNLWGSTFGAGVTMLVYLPWYILWRGGWLPEPSHEVLIGLLMVVAVAVYLWRKSRR